MSGGLKAVAVKLEDASGLVTLPHHHHTPTTDGPRHLIYIGPFEFMEVESSTPEVEEFDTPQRSATSCGPPPSRMSTKGG